jgi:hypothetical protein
MVSLVTGLTTHGAAMRICGERRSALTVRTSLVRATTVAELVVDPQSSALRALCQGNRCRSEREPREREQHLLTVIDCTNPVDDATGDLRLASGSAAELVARLAPGAHVVKALHLFAGASWPFAGPRHSAPVVAVCGDETSALERAASLIRDLGGQTAVVGPLTGARQLEEAAGFVMKVVASGSNPRLAVPDVDPARLRAEYDTTGRP